MDLFTLILFGVVGLVALVLLASSIVLVPEKHVKIITFLGQYSKTATSSPSFKVPFLAGVATTISMAIRQLAVEKAETITSDKVTIHPKIAVQYEIIPGKERESYYNISNLLEFVTSIVNDVIRSTIPDMTLDDCFHNKEKIGAAVKSELERKLEPNGYRVLNVLVTDIDFDENVKREMNRINAAQRAQIAAQSEANAEKIKKVTAAEAEAESMKLHGKGIADQRSAIVEGLQKSVEAFQAAVPGASPSTAMELVALTQYIDMMKELARDGRSKVIFVPSGPGGMTDLRSQLTQAFIGAQEATSGDAPAPVKTAKPAAETTETAPAA